MILLLACYTLIHCSFIARRMFPMILGTTKKVETFIDCLLTDHSNESS